MQNGTVTVDVSLEGELPRGARPDLSVDGTIQVERLDNVLHVGRPAYGQANSAVGLFKLVGDGTEAMRVNVRLGRTSVNTVEILGGLQPGEKVIISDMSRWDCVRSGEGGVSGWTVVGSGQWAECSTLGPRCAFNDVTTSQQLPPAYAVHLPPSACHPRCVHSGHTNPEPPMPEALIRLEGIKKVFYTDEVETHALSDIHLEIRNGEYIAIAGPSGCGKTTLLSILGLLDSPTDGTYVLDGQPVAKLSAAERARVRNRQIGFIFQAFNLIGDLTVYENVELPLTYRGMPSDERRKRVQAALERVGMSHRMKHFPAQLSGGQQQRVAVARAVAGDPAILLADEPTGNLDSTNGEAVMELLRELHQGGATICMVTHDPRYARHADRSVHLFDGKVVEERQLTAVS